MDKFEKYLKEYNFNKEQIEFVLEQIKNFKFIETQDYFDYDYWERDMWYVMNQSGLFEDEESNLTGITNWTPEETREYISEIDFYAKS